MANSSKYLYEGFEKVDYTDRNGNSRTGYNIFLSECLVTGYKPLLRYNRGSKSFGFHFMSDEQFNQLGLGRTMDFPARVSNIYFDNYGNLNLIAFE